MGKSTPSPPPAPDPAVTASAQAQANLAAANQAAILNRVNEITPTGSSFYVPPGRADLYGTLPGYATGPAGLPAQANGFVQPPAAPEQIANPQKAALAQQIAAWRASLPTNDAGETMDDPFGRIAPAEQAWAAMPDTIPGSTGPAVFVRDGRVVDTQGNAVHDSRYEQHGAPVAGVAYGATAGPQAGGAAPAPASAATGDLPWTRVTYLDPAGQGNLDRTQALAASLLGLGQDQIGRIAASVGRPLSAEVLPPAPGTEDFGAGRQRVEDALYRRATSRLDPMFAHERDGLEQRLANQGITQQSNPEAYARAVDTFARARTDAYDQALAAAVAGGGAEQSRLFGQQTAARQNALQEALALRNQPINELAALLGASPGVAMPQFQPFAPVTVGAADYTSPALAAYQGQVAAHNAQAQSQSALTHDLFGLGAKLLPLML